MSRPPSRSRTSPTRVPIGTSMPHAALLSAVRPRRFEPIVPLTALSTVNLSTRLTLPDVVAGSTSVPTNAPSACSERSTRIGQDARARLAGLDAARERRREQDEHTCHERSHTSPTSHRPGAVTPEVWQPLGVTEVRFARSGDVDIAYRVVGDGPIDLVYVQGSYTHLEIYWELPQFRRYCERLARVHAPDPLRQARDGHVRPRAGRDHARGAHGRHPRDHGRGRQRARGGHGRVGRRAARDALRRRASGADRRADPSGRGGARAHATTTGPGARATKEFEASRRRSYAAGAVG